MTHKGLALYSLACPKIHHKSLAQFIIDELL